MSVYGLSPETEKCSFKKSAGKYGYKNADGRLFFSLNICLFLFYVCLSVSLACVSAETEKDIGSSGTLGPLRHSIRWL